MKKIISVVLAVLIALSIVPMSTFAVELNSAKLSIESVEVTPGETFDVNVTLVNNPGIVSANLRLAFDEGLTLVGATNGAVFSTMSYTPPKQLETVGKITSGCQFAWFTSDISDKDIKDGTIITLTFELTEEAEIGDTYSIAILGNEGDFVDKNLTPFALSAESTVTAVDYTPGDVNDDGNINMLDVVYISRYIVDGCKYDPDGYAVKVNENAANINGDSNINMVDVVWLCRYIVDGCKTDPNGYNIKPVFVGKTCSHTLLATEAKGATCTEEGNIAYWQCTKCKKYYADENASSSIAAEDVVLEAKGHTIVVDPAVAPTYESVGYTEGTHCSVCSTVIKAQEEIPKLKKTEYAVTYHIANNDSYLQGLNIENNNPSVYASEEGLTLEDLVVSGYKFKGWFTAQTGGNLVTEITKGSTGNKVFYAQWEKINYVVTFDSPNCEYEQRYFTVDTGMTLPQPEVYGYEFVGWSVDGIIVKNIPVGTAKNITVAANWTSKRNIATAKLNLDDPMIIHDMDNAQYLFVYEIGKIENVPLDQISYLGNKSAGDSMLVTKTHSYTTSKTTAESIVDMVSNATTKASGWTLSEDWNKEYSCTNEKEEENSKTQEKTDFEGNVYGEKYYISNSSGGSSGTSSTNGGSSSHSSKVTEDRSTGFEGTQGSSITQSKEISSHVNGTGTMTVGNDLTPGKIETTIDTGFESSSSSSGTTDSSITNSNSWSNSDETSDGSSENWDTQETSSSTWNSSSGYEKSSEASKSTTVSNVISNLVRDKYSYTSTSSEGASKSTSGKDENTLTESREYASSVEYGTSEETTISVSETINFPADGYYRYIVAGTVHVFAVVGYDFATNSYFTYSYSILSPETKTYLDYSRKNSNFDDCENAALPFEVPYFVNEFINSKIARSSGLVIDPDTGSVSDYIETTNDEGIYNVVIPEYVGVDNDDGTFTAVRITSIDDGVFTNKQNLNALILPKSIKEIKAKAFEGCTNLKKFYASGISSVGECAFKNCTSLSAIGLNVQLEHLGTRAFENVDKITVVAKNAQIADATITSGAKNITLDISNTKDEYINKVIEITDETEHFALFGKGESFQNLQLKSDANTTVINKVNFVNNKAIPIWCSSEYVNLYNVSVDNSPGAALILTGDNVNLALQGTSVLKTKDENAVICKSVDLKLIKEDTNGKISLNGNLLTCGDINNKQRLSFESGGIVNITEEQFNSYLTSSIITFDPNGGAVADTTKTVYYGQLYGTLPVPTRDNYNFDGWYTEKEAGTKITAETSVIALVNQTLYAHWTPKKFTLTYDANGGTVSPGSKELTFGDSYGTLPTPTRDYYTFTGWYTAESGGTQISASTTPTDAIDVTIYAQWQQKPVSGWVKASKVPAGAQIVDRKWAYTLREYTSNAASSLSGWTKYETKRTGWSGWSNWATWNPDNGVRNVEWRSVYDHTEYHYYRWTNSSHNAIYTEKTSNCTILEEKWFNYVLPKASGYTNIGYDGTDTWANRWVRADYAGNYSTDKTWSRSVNRDEWRYQDPIYTYYYYRDVNKESTSYPSGSDVSNIVEWVMYREK